MNVYSYSTMPPSFRKDPAARPRPINQNRVQDDKNLEVWDRLTTNFWLPEKIPPSNDLADWRHLTDLERELTIKVFTGLIMLGTVQASVGEISQIQDARTKHEGAIYTNIAFMQAVHAKSYSSVFSTLPNTPDIDAIYQWAITNDILQARSKAVLKHYYGSAPPKRKAAATPLSSFSLYAGFYLPLHFASRGILTNTADMVRLILHDKAVHSYYSGYKFQRGVETHDTAIQGQMKAFILKPLDELYQLELRYSEALYQPLGLYGDVANFIRYNTNKALMNLGYPQRFNHDETASKPEILAALTPGSDENHDFLSSSGSAYVIGKAEDIADEDWDS